MPEDIFQIQSRAAFYEETHHFVMPRARSLMQWCCVGMSSDGIVSIWIFTRVEQQSNHVHVTEVRSDREHQVAVLMVSIRKQPSGIVNSSLRRCHRQIDSSTARDQSTHRLNLTVQGRGPDDAVGIGAMIAKKID